jgi:hypothetical protein
MEGRNQVVSRWGKVVMRDWLRRRYGGSDR